MWQKFSESFKIISLFQLGHYSSGLKLFRLSCFLIGQVKSLCFHSTLSQLFGNRLSQLSLWGSTWMMLVICDVLIIEKRYEMCLNWLKQWFKAVRVHKQEYDAPQRLTHHVHRERIAAALGGPLSVRERCPNLRGGYVGRLLWNLSSFRYNRSCS